VKVLKIYSGKTGIAIFAGLSLALVFTRGSVALADDFGTHTIDTGWQADNSWHDYCTFLNFDANHMDPVTDAMQRLADQTIMTVYHQSGTCQPWMDAQFDFVGSDVIGSTVRGSTTCLSPNLYQNTCGGSSILLNYQILTSYDQR